MVVTSGQVPTASRPRPDNRVGNAVNSGPDGVLIHVRGLELLGGFLPPVASIYPGPWLQKGRCSLVAMHLLQTLQLSPIVELALNRRISPNDPLVLAAG